MLKDCLIKFYRKIFKERALKKLIRRGLFVGNNFCMQDDVLIDHSHAWLIRIGNNVTLAPRVHILAHDASTKMYLGHTRIALTVIGSRVFIGAGSIILPGINIGDDVIIGAGSVVTKNIENGCVVAGNPAKVICSTENFLSKKRSEFKESMVYDESYTLRGQITPPMKAQMQKDLEKKIGYVV